MHCRYFAADSAANSRGTGSPLNASDKQPSEEQTDGDGAKSGPVRTNIIIYYS